MDDSRRQRAEDVFLAAVDLEPEAQAALLTTACADDEELRREVENLLAADAQAASLLPTEVAGAVPRAWIDRALADATPSQVGEERGIPTGTLLAGRFRVGRFIAAGGMGEVYEAEDTVLDEQVALKIIAPAIADSPRAMARFRREVHLARKVTHASVCRIYDLFSHDLGSAPGSEKRPGRLDFLSMELLQGETLQARIQRLGRLRPEDALDIVGRLIEGLDAAHRSGIVHRDLKGANVMLVPDGSGERVVITDFGLARRATPGDAQGSPDASDRGLTQTGWMLGTPATMAPEQITGDPITTATDIYALGVLMYEMVTGRLPFEAGSRQEAIYLRLHADPTPPRAFAPELDRPWQKVILKCLERRPQDRFATVRDISAELGADCSDAWRAISSRGRRVSVWVGVSMLCALLAVLGAVLWGWPRSSPNSSPLDASEATRTEVPSAAAEPDTTAAPSRRAVAVIGFEGLNQAEDLEWLSTALSEMLSMELARGQKLRVVPGETVARMRMDLKIPPTASPAADTLSRVRAYLGADWVVLGSYFLARSSSAAGPSYPADDGVLRLDLRLQDVASGRTLVALTESGEIGDLLELVDRVGRRLRQGLGDDEPGQPAVASPAVAKPATRLYAEGLAKLRGFEEAGARDVLLEAARLDPSSPMIQSALAEAFMALGMEAQAAESAEEALALSTDLPREHRLRIEGQAFEARKAWSEAIDTYRVLFGFFPDHLEDGLRLASAQIAGGRAAEALETLSSLKDLPQPSGSDPRIDLEEASAAMALADYPHALEAAGRALERGRELGARRLVARSYYLEGNALLRRREYGAAVDRAVKAAEIYGPLGDQKGFADTLNLRANVAYFERRYDDAEALYREALEVHRRLGFRAGVMTLTSNLANLRWVAGDWDGAGELYERSLAMAREISHAEGEARGLYSLGLLAWRRHDLSGARDFYRQALEITRRTGDRRRMAQSLNNLGLVLRHLGDLDGAEQAYEESLQLARQSGDPIAIARRLGNLGFLRLYRGQVDDAGKDFEQAWQALEGEQHPSVRGTIAHGRGEVAMARGQLDSAAAHLQTALEQEQESEDPAGVMVLRNALARLDLQAGRLVAARSAARRIAADAALAELPDQELGARIIIAEAAMAEGDMTSADAALDRASELAATSEDKELIYRVALGRSRLARRAGDLAGARRHLEKELILAQRAGLGSFGFEGHLEMLLIEQGMGIDVRERLLRSAEKAESLGLRHVAASARAAARKDAIGIDTPGRNG